jgi:hypothetical protein
VKVVYDAEDFFALGVPSVYKQTPKLVRAQYLEDDVTVIWGQSELDCPKGGYLVLHDKGNFQYFSKDDFRRQFTFYRTCMPNLE